MRSMYFEFDENYITEKLFAVKEEDVEKKFSTRIFSGIDDFITLISPAAEKYIQRLAETANRIKIQRFGKIIKLYAPLYVSNKCRNSCLYCGFNAVNKISRKTLSFDEIEQESAIIKKSGFDSILLVSGSVPNEVNLEYLKKSVEILKKYFSYIAIEIYPMKEEEYRELTMIGVDGLALYQETYNEKVYAEMHPAGKKRDYEFRLGALERGGKSGFRDLGFGILLGLYDWRIDAAYMYMHAKYIMKKYWKSRINFSFPRIRPAASGFNPVMPVTDKNLAQLICAVRICFPDAGLNLSTRENSELRNKLIYAGITQISAGSKTNPGGYSETDNAEEQFKVSDERTPYEIFELVKSFGFDPVWKDWDNRFK